MEVITPIIHINGTSKEELLRLREEAWTKLNDAVEALSRMAPHGRDYYPEKGRLEKAMEQHTRRMERLCTVLKEINAEMNEIYFQ